MEERKAEGGQTVAKEIKSRIVHRDIKAIDKTEMVVAEKTAEKVS